MFCPGCGARVEEEQGDRLVCARCGYEIPIPQGPVDSTPEEREGAEDTIKLLWHLVVSLAFIGGAVWLVFDVGKTPLTVVNGLIFVGAIVGYGVVGAVLGSSEPVSSDTVLDPLGCLLGHVVNGLILRLLLYPGRAIAGAVSGVVRLLTRRR